MVKRIWKISKKLTTFLWKMVEVFLALVFVLGGLVLYRLHKEPMDAMKYIPEIERALFPTDIGYRLEAQKVELTSDWSRDGLIQIDVENLTILRADNSVSLFVPRAQFSYDLWHILSLNYLPGTVIVEKPFWEMTIDEAGTVAVTADKSAAHVVDVSNFKKMLNRILAIQDLRMTDAFFSLKDNRVQKKWELSDIDLELQRRFRFSKRARLKAILTRDGMSSRILATANLNPWTRILTLETGLDEINLKRISLLIPVLEEANLDVQFSAKAEFDIAKNHTKITDYISKVQFNVKTLKSGTLNLMGDLDNLYYVDWADINGILTKGAKQLKIASSKVKLKNEKPADFYLDVSGIDAFLNQRESAHLKTILKATLYDSPMGHVPSLWPPKQGPAAHAWVAKNLSKGRIEQADFTLYFTAGELTDLLGDIHTKGVRVDYLNPMKPVENVSAQVLLYPDKVHILADKGHIDDLTLNKAELLFTDLDKDESWLQIDLDVAGPASQALEVISSKPLEFPQMFNVKPSLLSGQTKALVHLSFPLLEDLAPQNVQTVVHADITKAKVNAPLEKWGLKNGTLTLDVTNEELEIAGEINLKNSPFRVKWHEYFNPQNISSEYALSGTLKVSDLLFLIPDLEPWAQGKVKMDLRATKTPKDLYSGLLELDAASAEVSLLPLSVQKKKDSPLKTVLHFSDVHKKSGALSWEMRGSLTGVKEDIKISGSANWLDESMRVLFSEILAGPNQFFGELKSTPSDFFLKIHGKKWQAFDLAKISFGSETSSSQKLVPPNIQLDILLEEFIFNPQKPLTEVSVTGLRQNNLWRNFHAQAIASDPFVLVYEPSQKQFQGSFSDLGDLMERLNASDDLTGGKLSLMATQKEDGTIDGQIKVKDTQLKETGFLIQAMSILGIVDAFRGKDIVFDETEIPFLLTPDFKMTISDAFAVSTNLGITFKGEVQSSGVDLSGSVVPAYALNSLPGKIPVLGWLFRDTTGGGLINVPFTVIGPLFAPEVSWKALKTVAPGALGRLF
ncbi:MAG: DUF3971 domain-containing protein [Alphaproteobacteria bacterium]